MISETEPTAPAIAESPPRRATAGSRLAAEGFGSFLIVLATVGTMVFAGYFIDPTNATAATDLSVAVPLATGFAVIVAFLAFGSISGGHFNPAVTLGLAAAGRLPWRSVGGYLFAQVVGAMVATTVLVLVGVFGPEGWIPATQERQHFAANGWGALSPGGFGMIAVMIAETILSALLVIIVLAVTQPKRQNPLAAVAIGLAFATFTFILLPVDMASLNPARSIATALYGGVDALLMLWVFVVFPVVGAALAGLSFRPLFENERDVPEAASIEA